MEDQFGALGLGLPVIMEQERTLSRYLRASLAGPGLRR
jgi:hypothetical protein